MSRIHRSNLEILQADPNEKQTKAKDVDATTVTQNVWQSNQLALAEQVSTLAFSPLRGDRDLGPSLIYDTAANPLMYVTAA